MTVKDTAAAGEAAGAAEAQKPVTLVSFGR